MSDMSKKISVRLSDDVLQAVEAVMQTEKVTMSHVVNRELRKMVPYSVEVKEKSAGVSGEAEGLKILGQPVVADADMEPGSFKIESGQVVPRPTFEDQYLNKPFPEVESPSKFRTSPDGKPCRHMLYWCDRGCWK